ncbi:MAG: hypothetical protein RLY71_2813 [Pseudomonadota bacterium]|jgi:hypothetical protein
MAKSKGILPPKRFWTAEEEALMREHYADSYTSALAKYFGCSVHRVLRKANAMGLSKSAELVAEIARIRTTAPGHGSQRTRIQPGAEPWNKGRSFEAGGRSVETRFQHGNKPHTWVPVGSLRIVEGTLERKVNDLPGAHTVRWKPVHRLVWIEAHGEVPPGHLVVFKPGRKTLDPALITLDAVELVTREQHMLRNTVHRYGPEIASIHRLRGLVRRQINHQANEAEKAP